MVRLRFLRPVVLAGVADVCDFSGDCRRIELAVAAGDVVEFAAVSYGEKVKARGGAYRLCELVLVGESCARLHPDCYQDVPSNVFEEVA